MKKIVIFIVTLVITSMIIMFSNSSKQELEHVSLDNNLDNLVGVYLENEDGEYETSSDIPQKGSGYQFNKAVCENDIEAEWNEESWSLIVPNNVVNFKCNLYFDKQSTVKDLILANSKVNEGTPDFSKTATTDEGIYKTQDDWGDSYYFRGAVNNNWVKFAGYYWRIIRINGDGSIRVIYNGTSMATTGASTRLQTKSFNLSYNSSEYVGYMYTNGQQHGNTINSDIKTVVDNWYNSNLASYADKISKEAGFCGDREVESGYSWSNHPSITVYYASRVRLSTNKVPTLKCSNSSDLYTISSSSKGNKALTNPIGLISADESAMAGGVYGSNNTGYYLYTGEAYWTISPSYFDSVSGVANVFYVDSDGDLGWGYMFGTIGVRPVINIASDAEIKSGNGTIAAPYEI